MLPDIVVQRLQPIPATLPPRSRSKNATGNPSMLPDIVVQRLQPIPATLPPRSRRKNATGKPSMLPVIIVLQKFNQTATRGRQWAS